MQTANPAMAQGPMEGIDPNIQQAMILKVVSFFLLLPAMSIMPLLRTGIGFRVVRMTQILVTGGVLLWLSLGLGAAGLVLGAMRGGGDPGIAALSGGFSSGVPLLVLAFAFLPLAFLQNRADWKRIVEGRPGSTYSRGVPRYAAIIGIRGDKAARWIDPLLCFAVALVCFFFSTLLGVWLLVAGLALAVYEHMSQEAYLNAFLDTLDSQYFGEAMQAELRAVESGGSVGKPAYDGVLPSLPSGALKQIQARQRQMKAQQAAAPAPRANGGTTPPTPPQRFDPQTGEPLAEGGHSQGAGAA